MSGSEVGQVPRLPQRLCHSERSGMIRGSESSPKSRNLLFRLANEPVRLPKSAAPWPIPRLRILATRKGKQILPNPNS